MSGRALSDPTPWQTGLMHGVMSLAVFSGILGTAGLGVHLTGDAKDAGPRLHYALFESREGPARTLKLEQPIDDYPVLAAQPSPALALASYDTPASLPVDEPDTTVNPIDDMPAPRRPVAPDSIIINGTIVPAGKSLSEVTRSACRVRLYQAYLNVSEAAYCLSFPKMADARRKSMRDPFEIRKDAPQSPSLLAGWA